MSMGFIMLADDRSEIIGVLVDNLDKIIALETIDIGCHNNNSSPFVHEFGRVGPPIMVSSTGMLRVSSAYIARHRASGVSLLCLAEYRNLHVAEKGEVT